MIKAWPGHSLPITESFILMNMAALLMMNTCWKNWIFCGGGRKMKEIIIPERRIYVYSYAELSEESKGTAKQFYLDGQDRKLFRISTKKT